MKLTTEQLNLFNDQGFLLLPKFADAKLCDDLLSTALEHLDAKIEPIESEEEYQQDDASTKTVRRLRQVYDRDERFRSWMTHSDMRPIIKQILGENPVLLLAHHNSIMTKLPKVSSVTYWHQDIRYWHYENDNLMSVWLSLGDEYLENGLLEFIPGSHKLALTSDQFDEQSTFKDDYEKNRALIEKRVHTKLSKGDVVLFHAKTLHFARNNSTDKPKISFVYSLRASDNLPIKNSRSDFKEVPLL
jgi:phytanoyl-CoA hydroxylase